MKYHSRKTTVDGRVFDSKKEAGRYQELKLLERCGKIADLECQKRYVLIPAQYDTVNGKRECVEREVCYVADFVYTQGRNTIVEDVKGVKTKDYIIKRKLMRYIHGIAITEV